MPLIELRGGTLDGERVDAERVEPLEYLTLTEDTGIYYEPCGCLVDDPDEVEFIPSVVLDPFKLRHTYRKSHRDPESGNWIFIPKGVS